MQYQDMVIEAAEATLERTPDKQRVGRFTVRVLASPAGEMNPEQALPISYDDKPLQLSLQQLETRALDRAGLIGLGRALALLLLPPKPDAAAVGVRDLLAASLEQIGPDDGLRLRLRLPPQLAALPWEYLYVDRAGGGESLDGFLALDPRVAIVRHEVLPAPPSLPLTRGALKVVAALASAEGLPQLDLGKEQRDLKAAFDGQAGIAPVFLEDATLDELQAALAGAAIFHFAGHGVFTRQMGDLPGTYTGVGSLALYDQAVSAEQLGINLRGNGVRLAVLGGCETGRRDGVNVWSGIAPALVKQQLAAVIANQLPITDACAIAFGKQFYAALVGGLPIERAVAAGRIAAYNADREGRDWGVAVLYMRDADGVLFGGAADADVREQAAASARAVIEQRMSEVAAGAVLTGAAFKQIASGSVSVTYNVGKLVSGGNVTGATIDDLEEALIEDSQPISKGPAALGLDEADETQRPTIPKSPVSKRPTVLSVDDSDEAAPPAVPKSPASVQQRRLEAAMPRSARVDRPTEIRVMIALPSSEGLRRFLPAVTESGDIIARDDVAGRDVSVEFENEQWTMLYLEIDAPDFDVEQPIKPLRVPRASDSGVATFFVTPRQARADGRVVVNLYQDAARQTLLDSLTLMVDIKGRSVSMFFEEVWQVVTSSVGGAAARRQSLVATVGAGAAQQVVYVNVRNQTVVYGDQYNLTGNFQGSNVNIKSNLSNASQSIGAIADANQADKDELQRLLQQLNAELQQAPAAHQAAAEAVAALAQQLLEDTTRSPLNPTTIRIASEGLRQASDQIAGALPAVSPIVGAMIAHIGRLAR